MNTSANYEEIRQQLLQLTEDERKRLLAEMNDSIVAKTSKEQHLPQLRWLADRANREKYGGQYVALHDGELVSHSVDSREVIEKVKAQGLNLFFIVWVEPLPDETGELIGWQ